MNHLVDGPQMMLKSYSEVEMTQSSSHSGIRLILNPDL